MTDLGVLNDSPEQQAIENIKKSILLIEKMFNAMNQVGVNFPLRVAEDVLGGMTFLKQMHDQLLAQLSPEDLAKFKEQFNPKPQQAGPNGAA